MQPPASSSGGGRARLEIQRRPLVQDDDIVQELPPIGPDQPLDVSVLPRRSRRCREVYDAQDMQPPADICAELHIAVSQEKARRSIERKGFIELSGRPFSSGALGDVEVQHSTAVMAQNDENEQNP